MGLEFRYDFFQTANNKSADQFGGMRRLVFAFVGHKPRRMFSRIKAQL